MQATTVKVLIGTLIVTVAIFMVSFFYYDGVNDSEDPRVLAARKLLQQYERQLEENQPALALNILDEMEKIYKRTPGYQDSYEIGVILNNKATVYLVQLETKILTGGSVEKTEMQKNLDIAADHTLDALRVYENWLNDMGSLTKEQIQERITPFYRKDDKAFVGLNVEELIQNRVNDIEVAQIETKRRMSVSFTNLGMVNRYRGNLQEAKENYEKAIHLWERNYTAQDNLNILMDQPVKKRSIIDRMFPPDRKKEKKSENS